MAIYIANGVVHEIGELKEGVTNEKEWRLRGFVIEDSREYNGKTYSDFVDFVVFGNGVDGLADINVGDNVEVSFTCGSRKKTSKDGKEYWGTTLKAISVKALSSAQQKIEYPTENIDTGIDPLPF